MEAFLDPTRDAVADLGDPLVEAHVQTALPQARCQGAQNALVRNAVAERNFKSKRRGHALIFAKAPFIAKGNRA